MSTGENHASDREQKSTAIQLVSLSFSFQFQ